MPTKITGAAYVYDADRLRRQMREKMGGIHRVLRLAMGEMIQAWWGEAVTLSPRSNRQYNRKSKHFQDVWKFKVMKSTLTVVKGQIVNRTKYAEYIEKSPRFKKVVTSLANPQGVAAPLETSAKRAMPAIIAIPKRYLRAV